MVRLKPPRGSRDIFPEEMLRRQFIIDRIRETFELYGFAPLETPAMESWELLSAKGAGGPEVLEETYKFMDKGGRMIGLRYDLTVPLARVVASNPNLPLPFKRYQISRVWRYGDVAKGRLREFWQADADIVGCKSMLADAEVVACAIAIFRKLGFRDFTVRLNHRKILTALISYSGVEKSRITEALRAIDKMDKVGPEGVRDELLRRGVSPKASRRILEVIGLKGEAEHLLKRAEEMIRGYSGGEEGIEDLRQLIGYLGKMGVESKIDVDLSLARGLDYYTGPIFEVSVEEGVGSLAGGGRYDRLIGLLSGHDFPATGISLGVERIVEVMGMKGMLEVEKTKVKVFVANVGAGLLDEALSIAQKLRSEGLPAEVDLRGRSLSRQLEYADSKGIKYVVIVGREELKKGMAKLRNMVDRTETEISLTDLTETIKNDLD